MFDGRGFTLVEVLVALAVAAVAMGAAYVLLDAGLDLHVEGTETGLSATGLADTVVRLRADIARASTVSFAGTDSLHLLLPDGRAIAWVGRDRAGGGLAVYRAIDSGSGLVETPMRALAELDDGADANATLRFETTASGLVRAHLVSSGRNLSIEAAPWGAP